MIQCFAKVNCVPPLRAGAPRLAYVSKTGEADSVHPRVMHAHEDVAEIVLVTSGRGLYSIDGKRYEIGRGDLMLYNSGVVHDEPSGPNDMTRRYCCAVGGLAIEGLRENALVSDREAPVRHLDDAQCARLERLMETLFETLVAGEEDSAHYLMLSLLSSVWHVLHREDPPREENSNVLGQRIKTYIDAHYAEDICLQSIADSLGASPYYLAHVFKGMTGYSPLQYIVRRRIGEAQTLLIETDEPVTRIAAAVGYGNPSQFNLQFAKNVGMTPREYRRGYIAGQKK